MTIRTLFNLLQSDWLYVRPAEIARCLQRCDIIGICLLRFLILVDKSGGKQAV